MKKLAIAAGSLFILLLSAIIIIPLVVDVDHYRPKLVEIANQKINGQLELGKLSLSLWGHIEIKVDGIKLMDSHGKVVVSADDAFFHLPFLSVFSGAPVVMFKMNHPLVSVVKNKTGKINLLGINRGSTTEAAVGSTVDSVNEQMNLPQSGPSSTKVSAGSPNDQSTSLAAVAEPAPDTKIPSLLLKARLGLELKDALLSYIDQSSGLSTQVKDMNLILRDLSLSHPTELELWANLDTQVGQSSQTGQVSQPLRLNGRARLTGQATPRVQDGKVLDVALTALLDMDPVAIVVPEVFEKKPGQPTSVDLSLIASTTAVKIEHFAVHFLNAEIQGDADVDLSGSTSVLKVKAKSNSVDLNAWSKAIPLLANYDLKGNLSFRADAQGPADKLEYDALLSFREISVKTPQLKTASVFHGSIHVMNPHQIGQIDQILLNLTAPGSDLRVEGKVTSFTRPQITVRATSNSLDLDQWMEFSQPRSGGKSGGAAAVSAESEVNPVANSDKTSTAETNLPDENPESQKSQDRRNRQGGTKNTVADANFNPSPSPSNDAMLASLLNNEWAKKTTFRLGLI